MPFFLAKKYPVRTWLDALLCVGIADGEIRNPAVSLMGTQASADMPGGMDDSPAAFTPWCTAIAITSAAKTEMTVFIWFLLSESPLLVTG